MANEHVIVGINSYENAKMFKYLGSLLKNKNSIREEVEYTESRKFMLFSVQTFLTTQLLSKNLKISIYKTIILLIVLYGSEIQSLKLWEKCRNFKIGF